MAEKIQPALTAEEWEEERTNRISDPDPDRWTTKGTLSGAYDRHAVAALCLYGQPFGFTLDDLILLRAIAGPTNTYNLAFSVLRQLQELADHIEALLPPPE